MTEYVQTQERQRQQLCRIPELLQHMVMIDGPPRVGKTTLIKILEGLERIELERIEEIYDYVGFLFGLNKIDHDAGITLLRAFADIHIYNLYLGRNINARPGDHSSIFKSGQPFKYLRRLFSREHHVTTSAIIDERPIMQQHAHYQMEHISIHFDAFEERLSVIEILRHPLDLIPAYAERGYGEDICASLYNVHLCVKNGAKGVHFLARGWEDEYWALNQWERVVKMLHGYQMRSFAAYKALPEDRRRRVLPLTYEEIVTAPHETATRCADFLGTHTTRRLARSIRKSGCPRLAVDPNRDSTHALLNDKCSSDIRVLLDEMIANYETGWLS